MATASPAGTSEPDGAGPESPAAAGPARGVATLRMAIVLLALVALAEWIGPARIPLGRGQVVLLPMLWALLMAAAWGAASGRLPKALRIEADGQAHAASLVNAATMMLLVKLGLTVGGALPQLRQLGGALLMQELGHVFGTLVLGLPLALLLGIKREAVGATFSIGREGNLAIIGEKYGLASPEGRGVLAEYITGTVLGAVFIALLAGFVASLNVFDPRSLAMGAGVGSGSMMAAALGAVIAGQPAELASQLTALAAASNLLTAVAGFYAAMFVTLPACSFLYDKLEPVLGRRAARPARPAGDTLPPAGGAAVAAPLPIRDTAIAWLLMSAGVAIGGAISQHVALSASIAGMAVVVALAAIGEALARVFRRLPTVLVLSLLATLAGVPGLLPFSSDLLELTGRLQFLSFTTPMLALAGLSVAKDLPIFRRLGWRIVVVSLTATAGTFLGGTLIAELVR